MEEYNANPALPPIFKKQQKKGS
jgi:hypothetical protein